MMKQALASSRRFTGSGPAVAAMRGARAYGKEIKTCDTDLVSAIANQRFNPIISNLSSNLSAMLLNPIEQGTADFNRVGKSINMKSLRVRGSITNVFQLGVIANGVYNEKRFRLVVVHIKSETQAIPNFDDIFGGIDGQGVAFSKMDSGPKPFLLNDVTVLRDVELKKTENCAMLGAGDTHGTRLYFDEYIPLKGLQAVYRGTATPITMANIQTGALVMYIRASYTDSYDLAAIQETGVARLRYEDN